MITVKPEELLEKSKDDVFDVGAQKFYFEKLRPYMQDMLLTCRTDGELIRTIEKVINASDSFCQAEQYEELSDTYSVLLKGITDRAYFSTRPMRKAPEQEKEKVRELIAKVNDLLLILKYEKSAPPKEKYFKERVGYLSPNGENEDFVHRNMKTLNEAKPKERIPNI